MQLAEIQNYTEYLFRVALKKCGNLNDAEDLAQEVLLAALQYPKEISDIKSWLSMVLNHKYYDSVQNVDLFEPWLREIFPQLKIDIPKHLVGRIADFRQYFCYAIPMAFMKKAIADGDFDANDATPPMVFVVDDQNNNLRASIAHRLICESVGCACSQSYF